MRREVGVNAAQQRFRGESKAREIPVQWTIRSQFMDVGTCGRWALTLARESRHIVAFLSSGTTSRAVAPIPRVLLVLRKRPGALFASGEG